ncbi:DUF488 domain-containing protein [Microbacterium sp. gxy059]|uniref:DUF488 domain-containing protein n=1 Tax=Microbacterium sp. gxy059 TaxID=2957199 RepID=UPI003D99B5C3
MADDIRLKRVYSPAEKADGFRVLVDRLWPRGVSKERAALDEWDKEVAPSPDLRTWWDHDPDRFDEFARRYRAELDDSPALDDLARTIAAHPVVTLVYGARDERVNHATVLREVLRER